MKVTESPLYNLVLETHKLDIGILYFFKNVVISEINDGVHIDLDMSDESFDAISSLFEEE